MPTYRLADAPSPEVSAELSHLDPLVSQLLYTRNITTKSAADTFLSPSYERRHDPFLMTDMDKAVSRIVTAIQNNERIAVWSDYDCDGIPGAVIMHDFFSAIGFTNFEIYIPHRHNEGFGLNREGIAALRSRNAAVILTIDCGTTHSDEVLYANEIGCEVIITDHHEPGAHLPPAYAVLNPKRDRAYPFRELCGSGVVWKLIEGVLCRGSFTLEPGKEKWWLDMVGLATLADMVPLVGENRILAYFGLTVLRKTKRKGLHELFRAQRIDPRTLSDDDVGFTIAPRVNAASRMGVPHDAFALFTATTDTEAKERATHLDRINNERKGVVAQLVKEVRQSLANRDVGAVVVIGDPSWRPSLLGLVANNIVELYRKPAFVWGRDGRDIIKGSCRSDGVTSVVSLMEHARNAFIECGGHHASGGFSVKEDAIHTLEQALNTAHAHMESCTDATSEVRIIDADLTLEMVNTSLMRSLTALSPFGVGNLKPLFRFSGVMPLRVTSFGKNNEHTKIMFKTSAGTLEAISFFRSLESFTVLLEKNTIDLIAHVERSTFMGKPQIRLRIVDVV
jgi:single-stranded-DNA-specific exonuclease